MAFPTETFYGLGASALDGAAVARVFEVKGRPESKPLLLLVDSVKMAESLALEVPDLARRLMVSCWPGPLTLVLRAAPELPTELTAGTGTVGMRMPAHAVALALVRACGVPVTAPSANPSGAEPPTTADGVRRYFEGRIDLILDGGPTRGGRPSTILDVSVSPPRLVRAGALDISTVIRGAG
ncbi:MAG: threonylcarbamoyl-AMP synthase [Candidatus Rokubacteria bacterium]|nr:threonylcarbamoyl-AMP synthase [Candidatus Rokubacteria bacterium]